jgi:AcrR family transcriptional regulator
MYEIARRAGVGQGTLYRHFPDRSMIAIAIFGEELDELEALAAQHADDPDAFFVLLRSVVELQAGSTASSIASMREARPRPIPTENPTTRRSRTACSRSSRVRFAKPRHPAHCGPM